MSKRRAGKRAAQRGSPNKTWRKDAFFQKAKKESYVARSVYKLKDLDKKFKLIKRNKSVLDLGCSPGSWMQYACKKVGPNGRVVGVDLKPTNPPGANARTLIADVYEMTPESLGEPAESFDLVMSDMAPNTIGIKSADHLRSAALSEQALELAIVFAKPGGNFVVKIFMGPEEPLLYQRMRGLFEKVARFKPEASRSESSESYLIGLGKKSEA